MHIQYIVDEKGKKTGVQMSLKQWNDLQKRIMKLELFEDPKQAFKEMEAHANGKLKTNDREQLLAQLEKPKKGKYKSLMGSVSKDEAKKMLEHVESSK